MILENLIYGLVVLVITIIIDVIFGEVPDKVHPVIYMGNYITFLKNKLSKTKISSLIIYVTTVSMFVLLSFLLLKIITNTLNVLFSNLAISNIVFINILIQILLFSLLLSTTFSIKMLIDSVLNIQYELKTDINKARKSMSYLVSRNTEELTEAMITSAAIETLTENITDSVTAPLFYMSIVNIFLGLFISIPIAFLYRATNTMDAMLGYKTEELKEIGYVPANLDDILNFIPARITGYYVVLASFILRYDYRQSYDVLKKYASKTPSPNSGYTMAPTAGALNVTLIKKDVYELGYGNDELTSDKISDAVKITKLTSFLFILTIIIIYSLLIIIIL